MSLQAPRTSMFTFESAVHASYVLRRLNEQRQRDVLCDVTVAAGDRSFRAHAAVLASCSDYFHSRVAALTGPNLVITLPDEVTAEGFEPLLQFAYTSKLLFTKENIRSIHQSADFLGFHNMEMACFDFLLPKFSEGSRLAKEGRRRCCQSRPVFAVDSPAESGEESRPPAELDHAVPSGDARVDFPAQCPLNAQVQPGGVEDDFCLEACGPQIAGLSLSGLTADAVCPMMSLPCPEANDPTSLFCQKDVMALGSVCEPAELDLVNCDLPCQLPPTAPAVNPDDPLQPAGAGASQPVETLCAEANCLVADPRSVPHAERQNSSAGLSERRADGEDCGVAVDLPGPSLPGLSQEEVGFGERSSVEREVAEHLAKGFWPDLCSPQTQPLPLDCPDHNSLAKATDFHWLKQLDLSSSTGDCPFLRDLGTGEDPGAGTDSLSLSEKSLYLSSSLNSAEDSDVDTDEDAEVDSRGAEDIVKVQLPFPAEQISGLSRSAFQQLLRRHPLTGEQLEFVHDIRRRSKNRVAAQRCRKRKLDSIQSLEIEINTLRDQKERLIQERGQLEQDLEQARHNLSKVCRTGDVEPDLQQVRLQQPLAKGPASDWPVSALLTAGSPPGHPGKEADPQGGLPASPARADPQTCSWNTEEAGGEAGSSQTCPVPGSLFNAGMDDNL